MKVRQPIAPLLNPIGFLYGIKNGAFISLGCYIQQLLEIGLAFKGTRSKSLIKVFPSEFVLLDEL